MTVEDPPPRKTTLRAAKEKLVGALSWLTTQLKLAGTGIAAAAHRLRHSRLAAVVAAVVAVILLFGGLTQALFGASLKDAADWAVPGGEAPQSDALASACLNPHEIDSAFQEFAFVPLKHPPPYPDLWVELKACGPQEVRMVDETTYQSGEETIEYAFGLANKGLGPATNVHVDFNLAPGVQLVPGSIRLHSPHNDITTQITDQVTADICRRCAVNIGDLRPLDRIYILLRATLPEADETDSVRTGAWSYYDASPKGVNDTLRSSVRSTD